MKRGGHQGWSERDEGHLRRAALSCQALDLFTRRIVLCGELLQHWHSVLREVGNPLYDDSNCGTRTASIHERSHRFSCVPEDVTLRNGICPFWGFLPNLPFSLVGCEQERRQVETSCMLNGGRNVGVAALGDAQHGLSLVTQ